MNDHVAFTGTRIGMNDKQKEELKRLLKELRPTFFHHGDCVGADAEAHAICRKALPGAFIVAHPGKPRGHKMRADCAGCTEVRVLMDPLARNKVMVDECTVLIAAPRSRKEETQGSGTWSTVRYARRRALEHNGNPIIYMVWP